MRGGKTLNKTKEADRKSTRL